MPIINTGSVASFGTKIYVVGAASGIDTSALIDAAYTQKTLPAVTIDTKIEENNTTIDAYTTLRGHADTMLESLKLLKQTYGYSETGDSVYDNMTPYLSTSASATPASVIGVTASETAVRGSYNVEVQQLAQEAKVSSSAVADKSAALGYAGTFTLETDNGTTSEITVTAGMSLEDISAAINAVSDDTNVSATIIKTGDNSYTLALSGTVTGEDLNYASTGGTDIMQSLGVTDGSGAFVNVTQAAQGAIVFLDGLEINSSSNTIEGVLDGVDLTLYAELPGETINLEIDYDYTATKEAITNLVSAYNEFRTFYDEQQGISSTGSVSDNSVLFSDSMLDGLNNQISTILASMFGDDTDQVTNLGDMGIEFNADNHLQIADDTLLNDVLLNNYDELREMFQTSVQTDNTSFNIISNDSTLTDFSMTFDITVDGGGDISGVSIGGNPSLFEFDGDLITGAEGTIYEGLVFAYVEDISTSVTVDFKQGMADLLYNSIDAYANSSGGLIQDTISGLQSRNSALSSEATRIRERADIFYENEVNRYAKMEQEVAAAETLLSVVRALLGINNDDD